MLYAYSATDIWQPPKKGYVTKYDVGYAVLPSLIRFDACGDSYTPEAITWIVITESYLAIEATLSSLARQAT